MRCRRRYVCGCERQAEKNHSTTSARRVRSAWLPRACGAPGRLVPRPALPATWFPVQHSRPTLMSAGSPAIPSRHLSPNAENQPALLSETPSPLPTLLAGTHKCRLARRTSDWSIFWRSLSRRLALSLRLIHTIRSQLVLHSPIGRSRRLSPEDMMSTIPEFSPAVSRLAFHNTEASRTQHTHPIKERRGR